MYYSIHFTILNKLPTKKCFRYFAQLRSLLHRNFFLFVFSLLGRKLLQTCNLGYVTQNTGITVRSPLNSPITALDSLMFDQLNCWCKLLGRKVNIITQFLVKRIAVCRLAFFFATREYFRSWLDGNGTRHGFSCLISRP